MVQKKEFSKNNALALKGIAIIMMMLHHCFRVEKLFKNHPVSFFPFTQDLVVDMSLTFKICVSIFAFITGYGLFLSLKKLNHEYNWSKKQIYRWTTGRLIKTLSGFWIIAILAFVICQIINGRTGELFFKEGILYGVIQIIINFFGLSNLMGTTEFNSSWWYMSIAILFVLTAPVYIKSFKKYDYLPVLTSVIIIPRIIGWNYVNSSYISFLFPFLIGIIFAEKNLLVKIANIKLCKNSYISKIIKFIIETIILIGLTNLYMQLPQKLFWEIRYGVIPVFFICYLYEFFLDIPILKTVLKFLGKHSMNIFLIHEFIRTDYLNDFIYSQENFIKIAITLLGLSLIISIFVEILKKLIRYDKFTYKILKWVDVEKEGV